MATCGTNDLREPDIPLLAPPCQGGGEEKTLRYNLCLCPRTPIRS
jgi:hypothetical protein